MRINNKWNEKNEMKRRCKRGRVIRLGIFSSIIGFLSVYVFDYTQVLDNGFFQGYNFVVWTIILLQVSFFVLFSFIIILFWLRLGLGTTSKSRLLADWLLLWSLNTPTTSWKVSLLRSPLFFRRFALTFCSENSRQIGKNFRRKV